MDIDETCKVFDIESGKTVFQSEEYNMVSYIGEGYYSACSNVDFGKKQYSILLDENFQPALGGQLFTTIGEFSQGYCYVEKVEGSIDEESNRKPPTTNGYMDKAGNMKITLGGNLYAEKFSEDKAIVWYKDNLRCINLKGEELFQLPLELEKERDYGISVFFGGKAVVFSDGKAGLIDETGKWIINPQFDWIRIIGDNLVFVKRGNGTGVLRTGGDTDVN